MTDRKYTGGNYNDDNNNPYHFTEHKQRAEELFLLDNQKDLLQKNLDTVNHIQNTSEQQYELQGRQYVTQERQHKTQEKQYNLQKQQYETQKGQHKTLVEQYLLQERQYDTQREANQIHKEAARIASNQAFAQWRDGTETGKEYFYVYRPKALKFIEQYSNITYQWCLYVDQTISETLDSYMSWKEPQWLPDAPFTGIFLPKDFSATQIWTLFKFLLHLIYIKSFLFFLQKLRKMKSKDSIFFKVLMVSVIALCLILLAFIIISSIYIISGILIISLIIPLVAKITGFQGLRDKNHEKRNMENNQLYAQKLIDLTGINIFDPTYCQLWAHPSLNPEFTRLKNLIANEQEFMPSLNELTPLPGFSPNPSLRMDHRGAVSNIINGLD